MTRSMAQVYIADDNNVAVDTDEAIVWAAGLYRFYFHRELSKWIASIRREKHFRNASRLMHANRTGNNRYLARHTARLRCEMARINSTKTRREHEDRLQYLSESVSSGSVVWLRYLVESRKNTRENV